MRLLLILLSISILPDRLIAAEWSTEQEAQVVAEQVIDHPINKDKTATLTSSTSKLISSMTSLVRDVTDLQGNDASIDHTLATLTDNDALLNDSLARLNAEVTDKEVRIRLEAALLFAFDSAELRPDALEKLKDVLTVINGYSNFPVLIEGHTCSMGTNEYNQSLSVKRAASVKDWLLAKKVSKTRLTVQGRGETQPIADNSEEKGRVQNRRVELVMKKGS